MTKVVAVIGAGYGDEGKGMWVDYRTRASTNPLVIRANSGAQVGHTVVRNGKRHIFSHLGSGSLEQAPTLFTRYSVINPMLFIQEIEGRNKGVPFKVFVDLDCPVSTPYDMLLNQVMEICRGESRHGSCGVGFGVTLEREEQGVLFKFSDLKTSMLAKKIQNVKDWCWNQLSIHQNTDNEFIQDVHKYFSYSEILDRFVQDCKRFYHTVNPWYPSHVKLTDYDTLIFENGQGLQLDQEYGHFPHVTRSNTGFRNIGKFLKQHNLFNTVPVTVDYLTRCYTTRHGAGPLPFEKPSLTGINVDDQTNIFNEYQQKLRFAPLNLHDIYEAIAWDKKGHPSGTAINKIVTCCDQIAGQSPDDSGLYHITEYVSRDGMPKFLITENFIDFIHSEFDITVGSPEGPQ